MVNYANWCRIFRRPGLQNCALCGNSSNSGICAACNHDLSWIDQACTHCGIPLPHLGLCALCQIKPPPFSRCISPFAYAAPLSHLLGAFKYEHKLHYGRILSGFLVERLRECDDLAADIIVPTPLHWRRRWSRGFNQAEIIGDELSRALAIPLEAQALRRVRATPRQQQLNAEQRRKNLRGAFAASRSVQGAHVALVDDVVTTCATSTEISRVLLAAGAASVQVWCLARTP
jgi:ComF family protein